MEVLMKQYYILGIVAFSLTVHAPLLAKTLTQQPNIQHGVSYQAVSNINQYLASEKLDGIRGYWDGKKLITRQGNVINSPSWFTLHWPKHPVDGELWIKRDKFQSLLSCVSRKNPDENRTTSCWRNVRFMMFDLPTYGGTFAKRVEQMRKLVTHKASPYLSMITQVVYHNMSELENKLEEVIAEKGEGLMLHLASAYYKVGRNSALMKLKKHQDAEATVIGYTEGKGKYQNQLGAIKVKTPEGVTFKIGSGFSDYQRENPPEIGSLITYKYNGLTESGIPRFARFWRIKAQE